MLKKILIIAILAILLAISIQAKPPEDCYSGCPDVNHNDIIDTFDLILVALHFGDVVEADSPYKINRTPNSVTKAVNKFVGKDDMSCVGESFGENVKDFPVCKKEKDKLLAQNCGCADVNRNKEVDIFDLVLVSGNFGSKEPKYKIKKDNDVINVEDLVCVGQSFGKTGKEVGCKYCSDCGDGLLNLCDEKECLGLGDCVFEKKAVGGECGEKEEEFIIKKDFGVVKFEKTAHPPSIRIGTKTIPNNPGRGHDGYYTNNAVVYVDVYEKPLSSTDFSNVLNQLREKIKLEVGEQAGNNVYCTGPSAPDIISCFWQSNNKLIVVGISPKYKELKEAEDIEAGYELMLEEYLNKYPSSLKEEAKLEAKCTDSDGGKNIYKKGTVKDRYSIEYTDKCDKDILTEWECIGNNQAFPSTKKCINGCKDDGACNIDGDANGDGCVNGADTNFVVEAIWNNDLKGDVNLDGKVDEDDKKFIKNNYNKGDCK